MKKLFILLCCSLFIDFNAAKAQSFGVAHDTVTIATGSSGLFYDTVLNYTAGDILLEWQIISSNFPPDWRVCSGLCDPTNCYTETGMWLGGTMSSVFVPGGDFVDLAVDFNCVSTTGCYYLTMRMYNVAIPTDTALITFIVCKPATTGIVHTGNTKDITMYPNPAGNELNVTCDAGSDVKTIAIYNMAGKPVAVYKTTNGNEAHLDLENVPGGMYFIRFINSRNEVVSTERFNRQ